ncbi:MAG: ketoacyl-ACP synthase III [Deltaproteobacteria bacterium]|nr:ketoacyl-ACP synthase III [Deltaproteobacteria bacterium]
MRNAYISGTGGYVPPRVVTNEDLTNEYGIETSDEWIQQRTGIKERRFAEAGVGSAELGAKAATMALENAGLKATDLDMIIFATLSPEYHFPGSAVFLQEMLGLCDAGKFVGCLDIRNQCSGFLYGLGTATSMVKSGAAEHVLVVGGETHSAALDLSTRGRTVASLFGDGAGAVVVSATDEDRGVRYWKCGADGRFKDALSQRVWDIRNRPFIPQDAEGNGLVDPEIMWAHMDGRKVFKHAVTRMCEAVMEACQTTEVFGPDIDLFLFHQANMRINQYVAKQLFIPEEKLVHNIHKYGNTTAATIPLLMWEAVADGRLKPGMKVMCCAFGSGFTWGASLIEW